MQRNPPVIYVANIQFMTSHDISHYCRLTSILKMIFLKTLREETWKEVFEAAGGFCKFQRNPTITEEFQLLKNFFQVWEGCRAVFVQLEKQTQLDSTQSFLTQTQPHSDSVLNKPPRQGLIIGLVLLYLMPLSITKMTLKN